MGKAKGLSLLEIVISVTILVVVFFTTFQVFILGFRFYRGTQFSTKLVKLAQDRMEEIIRDRGGGSTGGNWVRFQDPDFVYMVHTQIYSPDPPSQMHYYEATGCTPVYDVLLITVEAKGPVTADMQDTSLTQKIKLKTIVAPSVPFYSTTTLPDRTVDTGSSNLLRQGGMK
ncbi:MAG: hypothetical protein AB9903_18330 [Vulcanimicrobiota bacterium]